MRRPPLTSTTLIVSLSSSATYTRLRSGLTASSVGRPLRVTRRKAELSSRKNPTSPTPAIATAIKERRLPRFARDDEAVVYEVAQQLQEARAVTDETYRRAVALLGEQAMVDLVTTIGFFTMVAVVLVAFEVGAPSGETPLA